MDTLEKIRLTPAQEAALDAGGVVVIPATWEEFLEFLPETPYRVEYHNEHLIIMGLAAFLHEVLVMAIGHILSGFYAGKGFFIAGSNTGVKTNAVRKGYYNPDITVVKGLPAFWNDSIAIITNPYLVVEVLSESTRKYDLQEKLFKYQGIESLREVVLVDRFDREVIVVRRTDNPDVWTQTFYRRPEATVRIDDALHVPVAEVFAGLPEEPAE